MLASGCTIFHFLDDREMSMCYSLLCTMSKLSFFSHLNFPLQHTRSHYRIEVIGGRVMLWLYFPLADGFRLKEVFRTPLEAPTGLAFVNFQFTLQTYFYFAAIPSETSRKVEVSRLPGITTSNSIPGLDLSDIKGQQRRERDTASCSAPEKWLSVTLWPHCSRPARDSLSVHSRHKSR